MTPPLPPGTRLVLDPDVRCYRSGRVLVHDASGRIITLSADGSRALQDLCHGTATSAAALGLGRRLIDAGLAHARPAPPAHAPSVTVVVPVRDRPAALALLLAALGTAHPVIVVSDGSAEPDHLARVCATYGAEIIVRPQNGGPAAARNTALPAVASDLIAFIDSDCLPPPGWIERLSPHFEDPAVAAVAPRIRPGRPVASFRERYLAARSPLDLGPREAAVGPGRRVAYVPTAALVIRRAAIAAGFDDDLRYGEDVDAVWRLHDAGGRIRYDPDVVVEHREPPGWCALLTRRLRYGTSAAPLAARHPGRLAPVVLRPLPTATMVAALCGRPRLTLVLTGLATVTLARRVGRTGVPDARIPRWAVRGTVQTTVATGRAATMLAAPGLLLALRRPTLRRPALLLLLVPPLAEWLARRPPLDPLRWVAACVADDAAYGAGVWIGCLRERTIRPLIPTLRSPTDRGV